MSSLFEKRLQYYSTVYCFLSLETTTTYGGSSWDADSRTLLGNPLEEGVMAFNDDLLGSLYYGLYGATQASMVVQFNEDAWKDYPSIPLPQWFMSSTMIFVEDGLWDRDTSVIYFLFLLVATSFDELSQQMVSLRTTSMILWRIIPRHSWCPEVLLESYGSAVNRSWLTSTYSCVATDRYTYTACLC